MGGGFVAVRRHPHNFGLQQGNAVIEFGLRIGRKVFGCEATRRVSGGAWAIRFFHQSAASQAKRLAVNRRDGYSRPQCG